VEADDDEDDEDLADADEDEDEDGLEVEEEDDEDDAAPVMETRVTYDWHTVNSNVAIWARDKDDVVEQDYQNFYHAISKTPGDALSHIHFKAEGEVEFKSLLFVPEAAGTLYDDYHNMKAGIRLYVRKVSRHVIVTIISVTMFIMSPCPSCVKKGMRMTDF